MKTISSRLAVAALLMACIAASIGCYPAYGPAYSNYAYNQDSKGYAAPEEPVPQEPRPRYVGVDPALVVAGVAAAGLLGYAIGDHHNHHSYYGPAYYGGGYYGRGYYGPRYCR